MVAADDVMLPVGSHWRTANGAVGRNLPNQHR